MQSSSPVFLHSHKQRILKYPVNQDPSDQHFQVSNYPNKFPHLEQLVQHYRRSSISNKEAVLLREPINGWPKSKGEYGVFVRPSELKQLVCTLSIVFIFADDGPCCDSHLC